MRRGRAASDPAKYVLDEKELDRISRFAKTELECARIELEKAQLSKDAGRGSGREDLVEFVFAACGARDDR